MLKRLLCRLFGHKHRFVVTCARCGAYLRRRKAKDVRDVASKLYECFPEDARDMTEQEFRDEMEGMIHPHHMLRDAHSMMMDRMFARGRVLHDKIRDAAPGQAISAHVTDDELKIEMGLKEMPE